MKKTGCAIHTLDISTFLNSTYEDELENSLHVEATVTEEGTGELLITERRVLKSDLIKMQVSRSPLYFTEITMTKSETISLTYEIGKFTLTDLPKTYEHGSVIEGKVSLRSGSQFNNIDMYRIIYSFKILFLTDQTLKFQRRTNSKQSGLSFGGWNLVLKTAPKSHYRQRWTGQLLS